MKKLITKLNFWIVGLMVSAPAFAADAAGGGIYNAEKMCDLIEQFDGLFKVLQTLAFVGAAFTIAGWAWGYISKPDSVSVEEAKKKGVGMLVGFGLLLGAGVLISILMSMFQAGGDVCSDLGNIGLRGN